VRAVRPNAAASCNPCIWPGLLAIPKNEPGLQLRTSSGRGLPPPTFDASLGQITPTRFKRSVEAIGKRLPMSRNAALAGSRAIRTNNVKDCYRLSFRPQPKISWGFQSSSQASLRASRGL
jgi:hypothetical protein